MSTLHSDVRRLILRSCKSNTAVLSKKSQDFTRTCGRGDFLIARYHGAGSVKKRVIEYLLINYRHDRNKFAILYFDHSTPGHFLSDSSIFHFVIKVSFKWWTLRTRFLVNSALSSVVRRMSSHLQTNSVCAMQSLLHPYLRNVDTLRRCHKNALSVGITHLRRAIWRRPARKHMLECSICALLKCEECCLTQFVNIYLTKHCICNWKTCINPLS